MKQKVELLKDVCNKKKGAIIELPGYVATKLVQLKTVKKVKEKQ